MRNRAFVLIAVAAIGCPTHAAVQQFTNRQLWETAVGDDFSTISFTGFADGTAITNQYSSLGVEFIPPAFAFALVIFANDGWGLHGPAGIRFTFGSTQHWVGVDYPGAVRFELISGGQTVYTSTFFQPGGTGNFAGLVADVGFDEVYLFKSPPFPNQVFIDDLHWGGAVPAPGSLALLALAALWPGNRRRRSH